MIAQAFVLALPASWLTLGVLTNLRHPQHNRDYVVRVLTMELIKDSPPLYESFSHRRITDPGWHRRCFALLVTGELLISIALWLGVALLVVASWGGVDEKIARTVATLAATGFAGFWGSFLVGGEWFLYWASEDSPQYTHFFMLLWGLVTVVIMAL